MSRKILAVAGFSLVTLALATGCASPSAPSDSGDPAVTVTAVAGQAPVTGGAAQVHISLEGESCAADYLSAPAGPVTFTVENLSAAGITEVELQSDLKILGEKENLAPGLPASSFTVTLDGGQYKLYCLGAGQETQEFTVTGEAAAAPTGSTATLLATGVADYSTWVGEQAAEMKTAVAALKDAVDADDLAKAQSAYVNARTFYEKIESDVEGFVMPGFQVGDNSGNLDYLIDMRASNLDEAVGWSGFHAIERDLWDKKEVTAETKAYAADLASNVDKLVDVVATIEFRPEDLANGAAALLEEVQSNKITGEEEAYSHTDLVDFAANVEGSRQAFAYLQPGLEQIDGDLVADVKTQFGIVDAELSQLRDKEAVGGYLAWTTANRDEHARKLSQAVLGLQQPMQKIAEKVATAQ